MPTITYAVSIWHEDETYTVKFQKARGTLKVVSHTFKAPMTVEEKDGAVLCTLTDDLSLHVSNEDATHFSLRATKDGKAGYATVTTKRLEEAKEYETSTYGFGRYFTA